MNDKERADLHELAECSGVVRDNQYTRDERKRLRALQKQGYVMLAWVLTSKGKQEVRANVQR